MPKLNTLSDLLIDQLRDLYSAETQLLQALPQLAAAAGDQDLRAGFEEHLQQTREHVERLKRVLKLLGAEPAGKTCHAMEGLITESNAAIREDADPAVRDAALIAAAQRVEHYEIAGYGTVRTYAEMLNRADIADVLQETLEEEEETDRHLSELAEFVNTRAEFGPDEE